MIRMIRSALISFTLLLLLTGIIYPFIVHAVSQVLFHNKANGSLILIENKIVGSELIGQDFRDPRYFWGRPSATSEHPYNAFDPITLTGSSGSNYGPLSSSLYKAVDSRINMIHLSDPENPMLIPIDLVTTSASGLDPNISVESAYYQIPRVAHIRGLSVEGVRALVNKYIIGRQLGFLGEPRVNVLQLNIALDAIK